MWESKAESIDVNYSLEHLWFDGVNGQHVQKPAGSREWEESKVYKLIERHFPRVKADKILTDLSSIALEWAKSYVRQRQTFKLKQHQRRQRTWPRWHSNTTSTGPFTLSPFCFASFLTNVVVDLILSDSFNIIEQRERN